MMGLGVMLNALKGESEKADARKIMNFILVFYDVCREILLTATQRKGLTERERMQQARYKNTKKK
jgi:hypothetical protein